VSDFPVSYVPLPDTTPKDELSALAAVYRFVIDRHAKSEDPTKYAARIGDREEVSHVDQRPD
jgi:hypothetical protein